MRVSAEHRPKRNAPATAATCTREMYIPMGQLIDLFFQWYDTTEGISRTILSDKSMFVYKTSVCERVT